MTHFGLQIPSFTYPGVDDADLFERLASVGRAADGAGFDSLWVMDHYHQIRNVGAEDEPMFEGYTLLAGLAARTERVQLGTMVTGVTYRNPAFLAKVVTTLDVVSKGRAILGIGAAWFEGEHEAYGYRFPPVGERMDRLEEAVRICRLMFTQERSDFDGEHYRLRGAYNVPQPIRPGGPPILVGGGGERRTLRIVAEHADMNNLFGDVDTVRHKLDVLERHCEHVGRDPAEITKTRLGTAVIGETRDEAERLFDDLAQQRGQAPESLRKSAFVGTPDDVAEDTQRFLDVGLDGIVFNLAGVQDTDHVELLGEALAPLR